MASYLQLGTMHTFELPGSPNNRSIHFVCTDCSRWLLQFFPTICFWLFWASKSILGLGPVISCLYISRSCDRLMHLPQFDAVVWYSYDFSCLLNFVDYFAISFFPPWRVNIGWSMHVNAMGCYGHARVHWNPRCQAYPRGLLTNPNLCRSIHMYFGLSVHTHRT